MSSSWEQFHRSLVDARAPRPESSPHAGDAAASPSSGTPLTFERIEPRLLLAGDPLLTAAYAFSETSGTTTVDATGRGLTGTLTNGPVFSVGKNGNGIRFDGVNDFVNLGNPTALRLTGSMTISAWINPSAFSANDTAIVSKRNNTGVGFELDIANTGGVRTLGLKLTNSAGANVVRLGATALQPNTWYHVAGVYDAATQTMHVYLNGQLDDGALQGTVTSTQRNSGSNVNIGRRPNGSSLFTGVIDDVRIYSRAQTQAEVQADMLAPVRDTGDPTTPTGLAATPASSTQINLSWTASTDNVGITGYHVFRNGTQIATVTTASYIDSGLTPATTYQYQVRSTDAAGNLSALTAAVSATTPGVDTQAPTVSLTAPTDGATVSGVITVSANASDNVGVAGVQFLLDGNPLGAEDTTSPYSVSWNSSSVANGTHTLAARARDAAGNVTTSTSISVTVSNTQTAGLTAGYAFNETSGTTTADASGNAIGGTLVNGPTFVAGKNGNAIRFDGVNDYVDLGNPTALQLTGSMTISAWVNTTAFPGDDAAIVSKRVGETGFQLDTTVDTGRRTIGFKLTNSSGGQMFRFGATTLQANTWYHIAGVYDAATATMHVYLNGQLDDGVLQGTVTSTQRNSTGNVNIGQRTGAAGAFNFNGLIDDVRIYARALTLAEIQADMAMPVGAAPSDTERPTAPTGLSATAVSGTQINLTWTASTDNVGVTGYQVLRNGTLIATVATTSFNDTGRTPATTYTYAVRAIDAAGNVSDPSATASATTPDTLAPSTPGGFAATAVSGTQIDLSWVASTDNVGVTGYEVLRDGALIATVTTTSYSDTGRTPATTYNYAVRAFDAAGNRSGQASASATTPGLDVTPPTVPTGLSASIISATQITLSWTTSTDNVGVTGYQIFRDGNLIATVATTTYPDAGLTPGTTYQYQVRALDAAGNLSALTSPPLSASTPTVDTQAPTVSVTAPAGGSTVSGTITVSANASDNVGVVGVQFLLDGNPLGAEDTTSPYSVSWNTATIGNGNHTLAARARDAAGNFATSTSITVTVSNTQATGLAAAYAFNETTGTTTLDASGNGLNGTLVNGPTFVAGKYGNAVRLDGSNDYVDLGNPTALQLTGSMTISAWVNTTAFPGDDAAIVSKRVGETGFQLDTTVDTGRRTIGFKLTNSSGGQMFRFGATTLQANTWYHIAGVYDAATATMHVYLNGQLDDGVLQGTVTSTQRNSTGNVNIGQRTGAAGAFNFNGLIDDVRIYARALTLAEIQADMTTQIGATDTVAPTVSITAPANNAQISGIVTLTANASDNVGVGSVQFLIDGQPVGGEDFSAPYAFSWDTRTISNGTHTLTARARDTSGNITVSAPVTINVVNTSQFVNQILATNFNLPTAMTFLPDGRLLVVELAGTIKVLQAPYSAPDPTPFLQLTNVGSAGVQQGLYSIVLDPNFTTNRHYYVFYTAASPNRDRLSRFTANATLTGTVAGSELILYEDPQNADAEHHGGGLAFGNDGKIYLTTGEHFLPGLAEDLRNPRGKILRFNPDGTVPTDNPFYDGAGPNYDAIWAYGLRNPYRAYYDQPTGRLFLGDVGGNDYSTAREEINLGVRGANYGWPNVEGNSTNPAYTNPVYTYPHAGRDAAVTVGFVYHGSQFPAEYQGSLFFADYSQNWIKRLTFDANGNVSGVFNFEPVNGSPDGPYGDIVYLTEGPDGALYYLDLGYSDIGGQFGVSKLRRIIYINADQPPVVNATATPVSGAAPLTVTFSSAGTSDPEGRPLTYSWTFGDGATSSAANPTHTYAAPGSYQARLAVSDGVNTTLSTPIAIAVGNRPTATILSPTDGFSFRAGDVITYAGSATDVEDGTLPASAYAWSIDFLHEGHVHPGIPVTGVTSGSFTIPTEGHDYSGNTRYRITLTVTDSSGLQSSTSVIVTPQKVNLTFDTTPPGVTIYLDGIARTGPFVYDTLVGFHHTIEARNQTVGDTTYTFASWSDGGAQQHIITVPTAAQTYTATYTVTVSQPPAFVQVTSAVPQSDQTVVSATYTSAQTAGNTNIVAIGWSNTTSDIVSVVDSAGNTYLPAAATARGTGISQAIYYARSIAAAPAGANTLTVTFSAPTPLVDIRATEYSGLDQTSPLDGSASGSGSGATASSGSVTTTAARTLVFGAGTTNGLFSAAGTGFTTRIITVPNGDIVEDQLATTVGSYGAAAILSGPAFWVMQVATFKAASQT